MIAAIVLPWGCVGERRGVSRDALEASLRVPGRTLGLPTHESLVALRYPAPAGGGADDVLSACLVASARRELDQVVSACVDVVEADPAAPRALAAARLLQRAEPGFSQAGAVIAERGPGWLEHCRRRRGACADLAHLVADERLERAAVAKDEGQFNLAVQESGRLRHATLEGPFVGDARVELARAVAGGELRRHATAYRIVEHTSPDGYFSPAAAGTGGLYRISFTIQGHGRATAFITGLHALRARVDGVVVAARLPEDRPGVVTRVGLELAPGGHVVELLALSLGSADHLSVALLDDDGAALGAEARPGLGNAGVRVVPARGAVEALAVAPDTATQEEVLWRVAVVRPPTLGPSVDEAQLLGRALVTRFGASPVALATAAEILGEEDGVPERVSSSAADALWARVLAAWPDNPVARITAARRARDERPDEALAAYRRLAEERPRYSFGLREAIGQLLDAGALDEAHDLAERLLSLEQSAANIDAALPALRAHGDHGRAAELEHLRADLDATLAPRRKARFVLDGLHTAAGAELLSRAALLEPYGPASSDAIGLTALVDPLRALGLSESAVARRPGDGSLAVRHAELLAATRGQEEARRWLLAALPLLRDSEQAASTAERYGVAPPWAARMQLADDLLRRRREQPDRFREHAAVALLDDVERWYYEDGSSLVLRHLIVELDAKEVLDRFGELSLGNARALRARVYKPDGTFADAEHHAGVDDVSLPELAVGDVVELLTAERGEPAPFSGTFETRALDGMPTPALERRYLVSFPQGFEQTFRPALIAEHGLPLPTHERIVDGEGRARDRLTFAVTDVEATPPEPFAPDVGETARTGGFAWGLDDELWAVLRGSAVERAARPDPWLVDVARVIAGTGDAEERLARVFAFVARSIEPAGAPDDAVAALVLGQGERTPLLLALCRAAGLDATPVALQLSSQLPPEVPDGNAWRISAVRVRIGARDHFAIVDGNAVLDRLPPATRGAWVLDVSARPVSVRRSRLPDSAVDVEPAHLEGALAVEQGQASPALAGVVVLTLPAANADGARRALRRATPEQARALLEGALSPSFPGVEVSEVRAPGLDAAGEALRLGAVLRVPLAPADDGAVRFEHLFSQGVAGVLGTAPAPSAYLRVPDRKRPLVVQEDHEVLELDITLPKGGIYVETPSHERLAAGPVTCEQKVEVTDGRLSWRRELHRGNARVAVADWPVVSSALATLAGKLDARLGFVLEAPPRGSK
ncbi:MAG: hypothetical protein HYS27_12250 [Deltaproteobacteria bacterium]|nr:hypothetical protein [Deltaproteobacteria bacterium]